VTPTACHVERLATRLALLATYAPVSRVVQTWKPRP
jgi:hypothetical protein